jgi:formate dehydrogenase gamma subunit
MSTAYVRRWSVATRLVHWALALAFLGLLGSGLALESPDLRGMPFLGSKLVRELHLSWAVLLVVLPALAASWDGFHDVGSVWREARHLVGDDRRWLGAVCARLVGRRPTLPAQGLLNAGQKLNVIVLVVLVTGLGLTGLLIAPEAGRPVPQTVREVVYELHRALAYALVPLIVGHILLATIWPTTRPALRGMLMGSVRRDWALAHHALWVRAVTARRERLVHPG